MTPTTQLEALAALLHHGAHDPILDPAHVRDCAECWVTAREAERAEARLPEIGWFLKPVVSLPETAPKGGPATAAGRIEDLNDRQWAVWFVIQHFGPQTDEELEERYSAGVFGSKGNVLPNQTPQSIRSRRAELVRAGHVIDTGERRPTKAGGSARVWRAVGDATEVAA